MCKCQLDLIVSTVVSAEMVFQIFFYFKIFLQLAVCSFLEGSDTITLLNSEEGRAG